MAFTEKKFSKLKRENKIRKTAFSIREFLQGKHSKPYMMNLLNWLNIQEDFQFPVPHTQYEWGILSAQLTQLLPEESSFLESIPFDETNQKKIQLPYQVLLDNIRSPFNAGSILRTADAMGAEKVWLCGLSPSPEKNAKMQRAYRNSGIPYEYSESSIETIQSLKEIGFKVYSIEKTRQSSELGSIRLQTPALLVLGNEEFGVNPDILALSDAILHIPMLGVKNSMNVAVAAGIALYQASQGFKMPVIKGNC